MLFLYYFKHIKYVICKIRNYKMACYIPLHTSGFGINSKISNEKNFVSILRTAKFIAGGGFITAEKINNILVIIEDCYKSNQYPINPLLYSYQNAPLDEMTYIHLRIVFNGLYYDVNTAVCNGVELPIRKDFVSFNTYDEATMYISEMKLQIINRTFFLENIYAESIF